MANEEFEVTLYYGGSLARVQENVLSFVPKPRGNNPVAHVLKLPVSLTFPVLLSEAKTKLGLAPEKDVLLNFPQPFLLGGGIGDVVIPVPVVNENFDDVFMKWVATCRSENNPVELLVYM